jgi:hypothetical protein
MTIEILYFEGCPNADPAFARVREVVRTLGLEAEIREIVVEDEADALRQRFLGSPSVRVDGVDIEPAARGRTDYTMNRLYEAGVEIPRGLLEAALVGDRS